MLTRHLLAAQLLPWQLGWLLYPLPELSSRRQQLLISCHSVRVNKVVAVPSLQGRGGDMLESLQSSLADALQVLHSGQQVIRNLQQTTTTCSRLQSQQSARYAGSNAE